MLRGRYSPRKPSLTRDADYRYEFVKTGQSLGENGNWSFIIDGTEFKLQVRVNGAWKPARDFSTPP